MLARHQDLKSRHLKKYPMGSVSSAEPLRPWGVSGPTGSGDDDDSAESVVGSACITMQVLVGYLIRSVGSADTTVVHGRWACRLHRRRRVDDSAASGSVSSMMVPGGHGLRRRRRHNSVG